MSDPVLSQLVSVESDLSEQVTQLEAQLSQLQAKREGLRTVIDMFQSGDGDSASVATAVSTVTDTSPRKSSTKAKSTTTRKSTRSAKTTTAKSTSAKSAPAATKAKRKTAGRKKKKDGRAANWQKHVQTEYRNDALPEAVSSVLRARPSEVFKIADVMTAIFKENMPKTSYLKARNRISNILSAGARDGTWYRGRNGRYSLSESVTKIK